MKKSGKTGLKTVPGIGPRMEEHLQSIGISGIGNLVGADPEELYRRLSVKRKEDIDRCVLYVFRCAVYYAENERHDPELLKWWNWKERD